MDAVLCLDALQDALSLYGATEIFNSDQGSQFTSVAFTGRLKRNEVQINMDGRGRAFDNYLCRALVASGQVRGRVFSRLLLTR